MAYLKNILPKTHINRLLEAGVIKEEHLKWDDFSYDNYFMAIRQIYAYSYAEDTEGLMIRGVKDGIRLPVIPRSFESCYDQVIRIDFETDLIKFAEERKGLIDAYSKWITIFSVIN